jgi:2-dehydropantoate 2-reductase
MSTMTTTPIVPLSIAIIGAGRIGSSFAYQLARASHQVTIVARPGSTRLAQLQRDGGIVTTTGERANVTVADRLNEEMAYDVVFVTVNAHQVAELIPTLQVSNAKAIQFMFVTTEAARLRAAVGEKRSTFGFAGVLATIDNDGRLGLTIPKRNPRAMHGTKRWADVFEAAGMPSKVEPEVDRWLRSHTPLTIAMEAVAGMGMQHKKGATRAEANLGAQGLRAAYAILREFGETPYPGLKKRMGTAPQGLLAFILRAASRSRFRDTIGTSGGECRGLIDLLVAEARQQGVSPKNINAVLALRPTTERSAVTA